MRPSTIAPREAQLVLKHMLDHIKSQGLDRFYIWKCTAAAAVNLAVAALGEKR